MKSDFYTHRATVFANRWGLLKGSLTLFVIAVLSLAQPFLIKLVIGRIEGDPLPSWTPEVLKTLPVPWFAMSIGFLFVSLIALVTIGRYFWRVFLVIEVFPIMHRLRIRFFKHLTRLDVSFLRSRKTGDFISALSEDTENIRMTTSMGAVCIIDTCINFLVFPPFLFYLDAKLALYIIPPLIIAAFSLIKVSEKLVRHYEEVQNILGNLSGKAFEISSGVRVIKVFGRQGAFHDDFLAESIKLEKASLKVTRYESAFIPLLYFFLGIAAFAGLTIGGYRVISGDLKLSSYVAFNLYIWFLEWPMIAMCWFIQLFRTSQGSEARIRKIVQEQSSRKVQDLPLKELSSGVVMQAHSISFAHKKDRPVLENISFELRRGEVLGLTGAVGSGKSSLLEIFCREIDPQRGDVYFEGRNLKSLNPEELSQDVLYLPQETFLFSKTLRNNLKFGLRRKISDDELLSLLDQLSFSMERLEERGGLWARLGERGTNFSGGQKQRIAIGRSLIRDRKVYLFDDVFSHLDVETEQRIFSMLKAKLPRSASVVFVSQRLETLMQMDRVLILVDGKLEYVGPPDAAVSSSKFMEQLFDLQRQQQVS